MTRRAFIISPIGAEGSEIREHADDVYDYIIRPAVEEFGMETIRSDHLQEPGRISDQMFREIFRADLCFAVLTGRNANVYYELALAQAADQPVVLLIQKGEELPFDIQDLRCVEYDLKPRSLSHGVYSEQIVQHLRHLEASNWTVPSMFGAYADLLARPNSEKEKIAIFEGPVSGKYNVGFYKYFCERILNAQYDIYITGDGFECADAEGERLANEFIQAFRMALKTVNVIRVQTRARASEVWARMLADLKKDYPDRFHLFVLTDEIDRQVSNVCVIDPECPEKNVVELMLTTERLFGAHAADLAGTALFVSRSQQFARDLRKRILALTSPEMAICPSGSDEIVTLLSGNDYYFAYGSNMALSQMKERCPSAAVVGVGVLRDYRLVFNRQGSYRPGGVASITKSAGDRVYGVIWQLSSHEFAMLDRAEDPEAYNRVKRSVSLLDAKNFDCYVYEAVPQGDFSPDPEYLDILIGGAKEAGVPENHIQFIESHRMHQSKGDG